MLSQFPLISRLTPLRRLPFWAQALALCALFAIAGVAVVDDYGVTGDEATQRQIARANANYIITGNTERLYYRDYRYYGIAFETPLLLVERAFGLRDTRPIYLMRHLLTHLFFIAGGFACAMLAYRMLGSRWIALFAMLMFLLHPRLYAHSFVNTKDIPFAALLTIALYLAHRAFRKDTLGAFLLCGVAVGLAINLRPFALMLPPMILAIRALDLWQADRPERKRILATAGVFAAATLATMYITHPHYWENPLRLIESVRALSRHPTVLRNLFMGEFHRSDAAPWNYIPVWFAITAPPVALALGALGAAAVCWRAIARPIAALRDRETRFGVMLLGCVVLPVAVIIALQSNIYDGWRQTHFLWAPFCLLAAVGLHQIAGAGAGNGEWNIVARLPVWVRGDGLHMARRALAYGIAGVGLITTLTAMAALHPHQQVYFNALADTKTPGALAERYDMDYWILAQRQSLEYLLARYPDETLRVFPTSPAALILPQNDRERIAFTPPHKADFHLKQRVNRWNAAPPPALHDIRAYGNAIASIIDPTAADYRDYHSAAYNVVAANGVLLAQSDFHIYAYSGALYYLSENCMPPTPKHSELWIFLHIFPENPDDLPRNKRERGFANNGFSYGLNAAFFENKCIGRIALPDYPIVRIRTEQDATESGVKAWRADIGLSARPAAQAAYEGIAAGDYGELVAQSNFDIYLSVNTLTYLKEPCAPGDVDKQFFLHIFPEDPADLSADSADSRDFGFNNLDFMFVEHGADIGGKCVALRELPRYLIKRIRAGQHDIESGVKAWRVDIGLAALPAAQAAYKSIAAGDYGAPAAQSDFDLYLRDNTLIYLKEPCAPGDAVNRFFLHIIPADHADLPDDRRESGYANMDFRFFDHGADIGGKCVGLRDLPDYAIERIATGQFVSGEGTVWRAEIELGE